MRHRESHQLEWEGRTIAVLYYPSWSPSYLEVYGYAFARLEIDAGEPLPISETGSMGRYERADNIDAEGGPVEYVRAWLDHAAQSPAWKAQQEKARQMALF